MKRKDEIEYQIKSGYFKTPANMIFEDYFKSKFVPLYATVKWKFKTWDTNMTIWNNDILPYFGKMTVSKIKPDDIERFLNLMRQKRVRNMPKTPEEERPYLSETTVRYAYTLVHCLFKKAVEWEDIDKSPVKCEKPALSTKPRNFWQPERFAEALADVDDELLHLAIHLAFRCTLRIGEVCALEWDKINHDDLSVSVQKNLQRVTLEALDRIMAREVFIVFPQYMRNSQSRLIMTTPKSDFGVRVNTMSVQLSEELQQRHLKVTLDKVRHGKRYRDYNLVLCHPDGRPVDPQWLSRKFAKWQKKHGIGEIGSIDFHSIRVSSTSAQLVASGGDIKSVQKVTGHKTANMVLDVYARSLDSKYVSMNKNFDKQFYGDTALHNAEIESINNELLLQVMTEQLQKPEFLEVVLKAMRAGHANNAS